MHMFRVVVLLLTSIVCGGCDAPDSDLPRATVSVLPSSGAPLHIDVEIASTVPERQRGLMFRASMAENRGMLFVYSANTQGGYWMRNTLIPLTIAYIGADGRIQELRDGVPLDDQNILTPAQPYRFVLEMNVGWFARHGVGIGDKLELPPGLPRGD
jgi:uncharacterized membrane protein (UPF0127 family)